MNKGSLSLAFRNMGLMYLADSAKFYLQKARNSKANRQFREANPDIALPPDYMMFEAFRLDYERYYNGGLKSAEWIVDLLAPHIAWDNKRILDWGCGPGRIIRHLPDLLPETCFFYGTDANEKTIAWCQQTLHDIDFQNNGINPPLNYQQDYFDALYGISIFTHLSAQNHEKWFEELCRVSKKGGIILITTQGDAFKSRLSPGEQEEFRANELVIRGQVKEGHRVYSAFHPPQFMEKLFSSRTEILEHKPGKVQEWGIEQDVWILKKKS